MIYRKQGSVVRWENGTLVCVTESGVAIETRELFECRPSAGPPLPFPDAAVVIDSAMTIRELASPVTIERLIVTRGVSAHDCDGRTWTEDSDRVHLALVHGSLRALIDTTRQRLDDIAPIAQALARCAQADEAAPQRLRVAACVTAALLPSLHGIAPVVQTARGLDGYGNRVVEADGEPWPNWYRPSYRTRPVRMPLHLRLALDPVELDATLPIAVGLLAPPRGNAVRVLVVDGLRAYPSWIRVERVVAAGPERIWYPYGGGSFGAELVL